MLNLTRDINKYKCSKIGDVLYRVYIDGKESLYMMFSHPNRKNKLSLKNMYWRMFEYGEHSMGEVRLEVVDKVEYVKTSPIEFK